MLTKERVKEAEINVKGYLADGLLRKTNNLIALNIFLKNAKDSLKAGKLLLENKISLWTIVSSYYAMFYMANAVLLKYNYKTGDKIVHKVTVDSIITLIKPKLRDKLLEDYEEIKEEALRIAEIKSDELIQTLDYERSKRGKIQYQTTEEDINIKAKTSLKRAKEFLFEMEKLL